MVSSMTASRTEKVLNFGLGSSGQDSTASDEHCRTYSPVTPALCGVTQSKPGALFDFLENRGIDIEVSSVSNSRSIHACRREDDPVSAACNHFHPSLGMW